MTNAALAKAIDVAGGLTKLAGLMGVDAQVIVNWRRRGVPAKRVLDLERATADEHGVPRVTRHELRPDLYPPEEAPPRSADRRDSSAQAAALPE